MPEGLGAEASSAKARVGARVCRVGRRQEVGYHTAQPRGPLGYWIQASLDFPHR